MKKIEEMVQELVAELKAQNNERIEAINSIVLPLVDTRYSAGGYNDWGLRFEYDGNYFISFHCIITKRDNVFKTDDENGLTIRDRIELETMTGKMQESVRMLHRKGKLDEFIEHLIGKAIPTFLEGGTPESFFLS